MERTQEEIKKIQENLADVIVKKDGEFLEKMQTIQIPDIKDGSRVIGKCEYFVVTENKIQKENK